MSEQNQRQQIVAEAITWLKTPYHHMGRIKGVGVDCGMLLAEVFEEVGLAPHIETGYYPPDWHLHQYAEKYLSWVKEYAVEVTRDPLPGDVVLHQFGRCISHGGIVVEWPIIIHAYIGQGVVYADATKPPLSKRQRAIYSYWR